MQMGLDALHPGKQAVVISIHTDPVLTRRLRSFGLVPGTVVQCRYRCPWGSTTALSLRGATLAIRTRDLQKIRVQPL